MNKLKFTIVAILVLNLLPLLGAPPLYLNFKTWVLVIAAACLWLTQPAFSTNEAKANRQSDKSSIIIILVMSSASVLISNIEWAYFLPTHNAMDYFTLAGLLLLIGGIGIRVWAINTLGKHFTATATLNNDHELITSGPYKYVRHPSYLGAFMAITGTPLFLNDTWAIPFVIAAMGIAYYIRITAEEKMLSSYFGERYEKYKEHTRRFIPYIW